MSRTDALVVAEHALPTPELEQALRDGGFDVRHAGPAEVAERPVPDLLLISASLGLRRVALVAERFGQRPRRPTVVVFPQGDLAALEACVRGGFDYVLPPFLPTLLCSQLTAYWERRQLVTALEEMVVEASVRERERDLFIAHEIQASFLPERLPVPHGWDMAARFRSSPQPAGDFYDGFELVNGRRLAFMVADVSDRGIGAALFMALIRTLLRHTAEHTGNWPEPDDPAPARPTRAAAGPSLSVGAGPLLQAVAATNRYLARNHLSEGYFATLFFGVLDPASGALLYVNGGHHPAVLVRAGAPALTLPTTGPAVGVLAKSSYQLGHCVIDRGDTLLLYTDGVLDLRGETGAAFGMSRLLRTLAGPPPDSAEALLDTVDTALFRHLGALDPADDITMLAVRRQP